MCCAGDCDSILETLFFTVVMLLLLSVDYSSKLCPGIAANSSVSEVGVVVFVCSCSLRTTYRRQRKRGRKKYLVLVRCRKKLVATASSNFSMFVYIAGGACLAESSTLGFLFFSSL
eukprot:TRINITY_DN44992_c0_g1_i1.p1 TRINITY_DN44992_c0_g1~~TRINITY_DN44992_c0_g1_i1.p1  ORF type:complete len:116 (+),score=2.86 TRINITY_DN44992_c0_g1_i1:58-405(+)